MISLTTCSIAICYLLYLYIINKYNYYYDLVFVAGAAGVPRHRCKIQPFKK